MHVPHVHSFNKAYILLFIACLCVSLSLFLHVWWSTQGWGATFSERDCTDVNDILLVLSATSYTSPWESTGSIDRRAVAKSWTGFLQSGSQALATMSARKSSSKYLRICSDTLEITKTTLKKVQIKNKHAEKVCLSTSLFSNCEQNSCKLQLG